MKDSTVIIIAISCAVFMILFVWALYHWKLFDRPKKEEESIPATFLNNEFEEGDVVFHKSNPRINMVVASTRRADVWNPFRIYCKWIDLTTEGDSGVHANYFRPEELKKRSA